MCSLSARRKLSERHGDRPGARLLSGRASGPEAALMDLLDTGPRTLEIAGNAGPATGTPHADASPLAGALGRMVSVCESGFRRLRRPTVSLQLSLFGGERRADGAGRTVDVEIDEELEEVSARVLSGSDGLSSYTHTKFTSTLQVFMPSPQVEPRRRLERSNSQDGGSTLRSLNSGPTPAAHLSRAHEAERRSAPSPRTPRTPSDILGSSPSSRAPPTSSPCGSVSSGDFAGDINGNVSETAASNSAGSRARSVSFGAGGVTPLQALSLRKGLEEGRHRDAAGQPAQTAQAGTAGQSSATSATSPPLVEQRNSGRYREELARLYRSRLGTSTTFSFSTVSLDRLLEDADDARGGARDRSASGSERLARGRERFVATSLRASPKSEPQVPPGDRSATAGERLSPGIERLTARKDRFIPTSQRTSAASDRSPPAGDRSPPIAVPGSDRLSPESDRLSLGSDRLSARKDRFIPTSQRTSAAGDRPVPGSDRLSPDGNRLATGRDRFIPSGHRNLSAGERPAQAGERPAQAGERPAQAGDQLSPSSNRTVSRRDRFIPTSHRISFSANDRPASAAGDQSAAGSDRLSPGGKRSPPGGERLNTSENRFTATGQQSPAARDDPVDASGRSAPACERPGPATERPLPTGDRLAARRDRFVPTGHRAATSSAEPPAQVDERPAPVAERPGPASDRPGAPGGERATPGSQQTPGSRVRESKLKAPDARGDGAARAAAAAGRGSPADTRGDRAAGETGGGAGAGGAGGAGGGGAAGGVEGGGVSRAAVVGAAGETGGTAVEAVGVGVEGGGVAAVSDGHGGAKSVGRVGEGNGGGGGRSAVATAAAGVEVGGPAGGEAPAARAGEPRDPETAAVAVATEPATACGKKRMRSCGADDAVPEPEPGAARPESRRPHRRHEFPRPRGLTVFSTGPAETPPGRPHDTPAGEGDATSGGAEGTLDAVTGGKERPEEVGAKREGIDDAAATKTEAPPTAAREPRLARGGAAAALVAARRMGTSEAPRADGGARGETQPAAATERGKRPAEETGVAELAETRSRRLRREWWQQQQRLREKEQKIKEQYAPQQQDVQNPQQDRQQVKDQHQDQLKQGKQQHAVQQQDHTVQLQQQQNVQNQNQQQKVQQDPQQKDQKQEKKQQQKKQQLQPLPAPSKGEPATAVTAGVVTPTKRTPFSERSTNINNRAGGSNNNNNNIAQDNLNKHNNNNGAMPLLFGPMGKGSRRGAEEGDRGKGVAAPWGIAGVKPVDLTGGSRAATSSAGDKSATAAPADDANAGDGNNNGGGGTSRASATGGIGGRPTRLALAAYATRYRPHVYEFIVASRRALDAERKRRLALVRGNSVASGAGNAGAKENWLGGGDEPRKATGPRTFHASLQSAGASGRPRSCPESGAATPSPLRCVDSRYDFPPPAPAAAPPPSQAASQPASLPAPPPPPPLPEDHRRRMRHLSADVFHPEARSGAGDEEEESCTVHVFDHTMLWPQEDPSDIARLLGGGGAGERALVRRGRSAASRDSVHGDNDDEEMEEVFSCSGAGSDTDTTMSDEYYVRDDGRATGPPRARQLQCKLKKPMMQQLKQPMMQQRKQPMQPPRWQQQQNKKQKTTDRTVRFLSPGTLPDVTETEL